MRYKIKKFEAKRQATIRKQRRKASSYTYSGFGLLIADFPFEMNNQLFSKWDILNSIKRSLSFFLVALSLGSVTYAAPLCQSLFEDDLSQILSSHPLLGKQEIKDQQGYAYFRNAIFSLRSEIDFPRVDHSYLDVQNSLINAGRGNKEILIAELAGKKVVAKISNPRMRAESQVLNEARWLMFLNKFGLAPEFLGLIRTPEGELGLVMEYVEGESVGFNQLPSKTQIRKEHIANIQAAGALLIKLQIQYAPDMQFILQANGHATLIDPEYFSFQTPRDNPFNPNEVPIHPQMNVKHFTQNLMQVMQQQQQGQQTQVTTEIQTQNSPSLIIIPGQEPTAPKEAPKIILLN